MSARPARASALLALVWLAGVAVATSVGLLAVRLVAAQVGDPAVPPLSAAAVASATAGATAPAPSAAPSAPVGPTPGPSAATPVARAFPSAAGNVGVQCTGAVMRLLYATPAEGFALDERSVTGSEAEVRFEGGGTRVRLRVSCATGEPRLVEQRTDDSGGGGGGRGEGGSGGDD